MLRKFPEKLPISNSNFSHFLKRHLSSVKDFLKLKTFSKIVVIDAVNFTEIKRNNTLHMVENQ